MNHSSLGIVILNYNSNDIIQNCINSILRYYGEGIRIVIVDNHSTDDSYQILKENYQSNSNIDILQSEYNGGYSYGNNFGLKYLSTTYNEIEFFAVINPDVSINSNKIFQNLIKRLKEDESMAGISPLMIVNDYIKPERWAIRLPRYINNFLSSFVILKSVNPLLYKSFEIDPKSLIAYVDVLPGSFFIIKKSVFTRVNFLDENVFLFGEEIILAKKIKDLHYKLGLSFCDFYFHNHSEKNINLSKKLGFIWLSLKSHLYFNFNYNNIFWGTIDSILLLLFVPLRVVESIIIHLLINR